MTCPRLVILFLPFLLIKLVVSAPLPDPTLARFPSTLQVRAGPPAVPGSDLLINLYNVHRVNYDRAMGEAARAGLYYPGRLTAAQRERIAQMLALKHQAEEGMQRVLEEAGRQGRLK
ncbi:unnamed protein product [Tilletia laevis]|uniref:Uncharacterized protein n=1 Tax=Tilletia laevis TaxID=157183 RepID=A0A9N8M6G2_9BASI|nr:hypothetical protein CF336_g2040 [Tilletia laevis]KAE8200490.1 hypothetical protein CF335_g3951 [Tilletia laevis]CAD6915465.1 unnamed protein product [Tilletia controversa]CAD6959929.1 unnamed protein product [Tilletia laevis]